MKQRILGFDVARALAIFGMVIVNFKIAMGAEQGNKFLLWFASIFEGRASALFVVLAGVGIAFLTRKARKAQTSELILSSRKTLIKRGLLLVLIGLAYTPVWPADILHFYGFYFLVATVLFNISDRHLLLAAAIVTLAFPVLLGLFDYDKGWDWTTLSYSGFWTVDGMLRRIFFNGFHPVIPWLAFLFLGMWLGRQDISSNVFRKKALVWGLSIWATTELTFVALRAAAANFGAELMTVEDAEAILSTSLLPPMPQYVIAAGSLAVVSIICCLYLAERFAGSKLINWLYKTGQLSLTLYVAHVILGMGVLESIGRLDNQSIDFAMLSAGIFCVLGIVFSVLWLKYFKAGPFEWLFRKIGS